MGCLPLIFSEYHNTFKFLFGGVSICRQHASDSLTVCKCSCQGLNRKAAGEEWQRLFNSASTRRDQVSAVSDDNRPLGKAGTVVKNTECGMWITDNAPGP